MAVIPINTKTQRVLTIVCLPAAWTLTVYNRFSKVTVSSPLAKLSPSSIDSDAIHTCDQARSMEAKQLDDGIDRYVRISRRDRRVVVSAGQPADCLHGIGSIALRHSDLTAGASTDHVNLQLFEIHAMPL